jgi:hypothetical protein
MKVELQNIGQCPPCLVLLPNEKCPLPGSTAGWATGIASANSHELSKKQLVTALTFAHVVIFECVGLSTPELAVIDMPLRTLACFPNFTGLYQPFKIGEVGRIRAEMVWRKAPVRRRFPLYAPNFYVVLRVAEELE